MMINNPFAMVVAIIAIVFAAKVIRTAILARAQRERSEEAFAGRGQMEQDIDTLARRVEVLERLVTDKDRRLADEIERLRRRDPPEAPS